MEVEGISTDGEVLKGEDETGYLAQHVKWQIDDTAYNPDASVPKSSRQNAGQRIAYLAYGAP